MSKLEELDAIERAKPWPNAPPILDHRTIRALIDIARAAELAANAADGSDWELAQLRAALARLEIE